MQLTPLLLTVLSVLSTATAAGPNGEPYWLMSGGENKKCPFGDSRLFKSTSQDYDIQSCYEQCSNTQGCKFISYGLHDNLWNCMGCTGASFGNHNGFEVYQTDLVGDNTEAAETIPEIPADAPYQLIPGGENKKCPYDNTRLFKTVSVDYDIQTCYEQCRSIQNCKHISYGLHDGKWNCMGCNGHEYGYDNHNGFKVYEIEMRDDWEFTKVAAKRHCASQRYGDAIPGVTQEECHTLCKNTPGCGYFSMSDMGFNPIGSGTCNLCRYADGFSGQTISNTYSVLSPADYKPVCEGPTGVVWGDPHFITFDKLRYDCQGRGEYVLVKSNGDDPLAIHGVFEDTGGSATGPSVTRSVAILVDENVPVLQITIPDMPDANGKCDFSYTLGDNEIPIAADEIVSHFANNYPGEANVYTNEKAVIVTFPDYQTRIEILVHSGHFTRFGCRMRASICVTPKNHGGEGNIVGLFGSPTNDKSDDWMKSDAAKTPVTVPVNNRSALRREGTAYCRENWCVNRQESLYGDATYTDHNKCADDSFDADAYEEMINNLPNEVKEQCSLTANPDECIADTAVLKKLKEDDGETVDLEDLMDAVDDIKDEEEDSEKVSNTSEAELYSEEDWSTPDVTTLNTQATAAAAINNGLVSEITIQVDEVSDDPTCPVCKSRGWGDPHIITFDGVTYDVHVKGELTFLKSLSTDFEIQARTEIVANHPKGPAVTTAVVVHEDSTKNLPVIQVSLARPVDGPSVQIARCPVQLFVDGQYRDITTGTGSADATVQVKRNRIVVEYPSSDLRLDLRVNTWRNTCHFSVTYILADCRCDETLVGILGQPGGGPMNDWHEHNGTAVYIPSSRKERRGQKAYDYSLTWCLESAADSHFTYEGGNTFDTFDNCSPDNYDDTLTEIIEIASEEAKANCTINGEVDYGCIIECEYFGEEACDEYKEIVQNTATADITEPPTESPTSGPTEAQQLGTNGNGNTFDDTPEGDGTDENEVSDADTADTPDGDGTDGGDTPDDGDGTDGGDTPDGDGTDGGDTPDGDGTDGGDTPDGDGTDGGDTPDGDGTDGGDTPDGDGTDGGDTPDGDGTDGGDGNEESGTDTTDLPDGDGGDGNEESGTDTTDLPDGDGGDGNEESGTDTTDLPDGGGDGNEESGTDTTDLPRDSGSNGDPHFKTWHNEHFEYHSQCDLILASDPKFADGLGLDVQIRTKLVRFWSYIKNAAIRIGDDILEVEGNGQQFDNGFKYWYNFQFQGDIQTIGGFPVTMIKGYGKSSKNRFTIDLSSKYPGQKIEITTWKEFVRVDFLDASIEAFGQTVGMLGDFKTGNTLSRDGRVLHDFSEFGDEWQVRPTDNMLFHDVEKPQFPKKCIQPEDPQGERRRRLEESSVTEEQAEKACASLTDPLDRKDCVYDIIATQDMDMAGAY